MPKAPQTDPMKYVVRRPRPTDEEVVDRYKLVGNDLEAIQVWSDRTLSELRTLLNSTGRG